MKISVIIPNYNGEKILQKNLSRVISVLESYGRKHSENIELIVNDDGSTDKSREVLKDFSEKEYAHIKYITLANEKNYGFSTTVNRGVKQASGEIVVLLNTDVIPESGFLEPLLTHFTDDSVFAVGCMDKSVEPDGVALRGRGVGSWKRGFLVHKRGDLDKTNTLWVSGGSGAFRKSMWDKLGGLNELMNPYYWEDIDLSYRALKAGYKLIFEKNSTVTHEHEEGAIKKTVTPERVRVIAYRNQFYFVWINISDLSFLISHIVWLPYHFIKTLLKGDILFSKAFILAISQITSVLKKRADVQRLSKIADHVALMNVYN